MDELHRRVVRNIKERAAAKRVPISHVPDRAGVSRAHFFDVLKGRKSPTLKWLAQVARAVDADVSDLVAKDG